MSMRWSSEYTTVSVREVCGGALAVDSGGTWALLAGRRAITVQMLESATSSSSPAVVPTSALPPPPTTTTQLYTFPRHSKYQVGRAEWCPAPHNTHLCAISSNQRVEIVGWQEAGQLAQTHMLKGHTRVITDINWHREEANTLASCSVDTFIHVWDIRDARRPTLSLSAVAEASQVRWNPLNPSLLATAHDGDVKVWDRRKGSGGTPLTYIAAHLAKIHSLQWSPHAANCCATSSQDGTVKLWDVTQPRRAELILNTGAPVWRARFTPFGQALVTAVVPQLRPSRCDNSLLLWHLADSSYRHTPPAPIHTFVGHTDVVLEFEWRPQQPGSVDHQLVTWSKDQTLRVWRIDPYLQKLCGHEPDGGGGDDNGNGNDSDATRDELDRQEPAVPMYTLPNSLQQEFSLVNQSIPHTEITEMDVAGRRCTVAAGTRTGALVVLRITFPAGYPINAAPSFQFTAGTSVNETVREELIQELRDTAQQRVAKQRGCLEPCLRRLVATLDHLNSTSSGNGNGSVTSSTSNLSPIVQHQHQHQPDALAYIPFPRTSGAKFCSVSLLVCFGRAPHARRLSLKLEPATPRALAALHTTRQHNTDNVTVSSFYFQDKKQQQQQQQQQQHRSRGQQRVVRGGPLVTVYDARGLFLVSRALGERYALQGDAAAVCRYNGAVAAAVAATTRPDLVQVWAVAELVARARVIASNDHQHINLPWTLHPFGRPLLNSLIRHYAAQHDIQTAAMLCCVFGDTPPTTTITNTHIASGKWWLKAGGSPYHTIPPADVACAADSWNFASLRQQRSGSLDELRLDEHEHEHELDGNNTVQSPTCAPPLDDAYKLAYAGLLERWGLLYARAHVLKHVTTYQDHHRGVEFLTDCQHCERPVRGAQCGHCKLLSFRCSLCHVSVRGSANFCLVCGHGGHTLHLRHWFQHNRLCPTGCGCHCLQETQALLHTHTHT